MWPKQQILLKRYVHPYRNFYLRFEVDVHSPCPALLYDWTLSLFLQLATFLAKRIVPDFRRFSIDNDKLAATCANIMYYNVSPAFKTRTKTFEVDDSVLDLLLELTKVPAALKSWRAQVLEVYNDNRFFYGTPTTAQRWKGIVQALITSDKERFPELIHRISTTTSSAANIFINRELESLSKSMSIRRLSYTIFCAEKNRYLTQLPAIQEKVVDLLRANVSDLVHSEVSLHSWLSVIH